MFSPAQTATFDEIEGQMARSETISLPVKHRFTPGMYCREIFIPAGTLLTSAEHKTEHPFVLAQGEIAVISQNEGSIIYQAPHCGVTLPGTRRMLHAHTDCVWITFHATTKTDLEEISLDLYEPIKNPHLPPDFVPDYQTQNRRLEVAR